MTNIKQMRQFYRVYADDRIGQTLSDEFGSNLPTVSGGRKFYLSWSHYLKLMRMKEEGKRHFYEIEAARNGWSAGGYPAPAYEVSYGRPREAHAAAQSERRIGRKAGRRAPKCANVRENANRVASRARMPIWHRCCARLVDGANRRQTNLQGAWRRRGFPKG
ncbi:MAG: hypothetical protein IJO87_07180 [Eggerthellaceae bacterium]|nr:hypothetical protein [Eggerthellaceae bacterium]